MTQFIAHPSAPTRLDVLLAAHLGLSRANVQRMIKAGQVTVNSKMGVVDQRVKEGDAVEWEGGEIKNDKLKIIDSADVSPIEFVAVTDDYLIINKPIGVLTHPIHKMSEPSIIAQVLEEYPEVKKVGDHPLRPGVVQRLDRDVSGVMVIARTPEAFEHLKKQFQERLVHKEYVAIVHGKMSSKAGVIDFPIGRSTTKTRKMAVLPKGQEGHAAVTEYEVIKEFRNRTLLSVRPHTGRTNQIRAHLAALNHPIEGDHIYKPKKFKMTKRGRIMLHARELRFMDMKGQQVVYRVEMPEGFEEYEKSKI